MYKGIKIILLAGLLLTFCIAADAQRRTKPTRKAKPAQEEVEEDPRITQMLASTQQVIFIDSMVVDKSDYMRLIPLSPHIGRLTQTGELGTFTNEMGDHRLTTTPDSTIASSDFIANRWTEQQPIVGIGTSAAANPFLMPDGITLYFAQKGEKSIGGYDIFVTRYDSEKGAFLRPENLGMPFASDANDLFFAIDEFNQLGYFVTDRRQPSGKVCIYVFIPNEQRRTYRSEAYSDQQLRSLAAIGRIADTWTDSQALQEALSRLESLHSDKTEKEQHDSENVSELDALRHEAEVQQKTLAISRNRYATASEEERAGMAQAILAAERQLEELQAEIHLKEKQIPYNN